MFRSFAPEENRMGGESMEVIKVNKMEVRMDEKQTVWDVAEELRKVLRANEKRFMTLPAVREKLSSQLRKHLGMTGRRLTAPSLKKILEPHLDDTLEIRTNGRYTYLVAVGDPGDLIADFIEKKPGKMAGGLASSLPFRKAEFLSLLNSLMKEGRLYAVLKDDYKACFFVSEGPGAAGRAERPTPPLEDTFGKRREQFHAAFRELDRGSIFVRICDLRRRMGWPREVFDDMLRRLRDNEVVQLHAGDVTLMTPEQVEDGFVDENGFRMGTMTWIG